MNPVVGPDVAKGGSPVQMFLDKKMPYKSSVKIEHTVEGLEELHSFLLELEHQTGMKGNLVVLKEVNKVTVNPLDSPTGYAF